MTLQERHVNHLNCPAPSIFIKYPHPRRPPPPPARSLQPSSSPRLSFRGMVTSSCASGRRRSWPPHLRQERRTTFPKHSKRSTSEVISNARLGPPRPLPPPRERLHPRTERKTPVDLPGLPVQGPAAGPTRVVTRKAIRLFLTTTTTTKRLGGLLRSG